MCVDNKNNNKDNCKGDTADCKKAKNDNKDLGFADLLEPMQKKLR